jgi:hypothetical protein
MKAKANMGVAVLFLRCWEVLSGVFSDRWRSTLHSVDGSEAFGSRFAIVYLDITGKSLTAIATRKVREFQDTIIVRTTLL